MESLIRILPQEVANQIAAGEVVERPAQVVKELIENALDAGARRLELDLEGGGIRLIRLRDDGQGMSPVDLERCILPHATSKISCVEDLFRVASFGFRGEALPSIASVSETIIVSRAEGEPLGARLSRSEQGKIEVVPAGAPVGTTVEVRELFASVPARRKFLKQERTELSMCLDMVQRLLLPEPEVAIQVRHGGKRVLDLPADADRRARLGSLFGRELASNLLSVTSVQEDLSLEAYVGPASLVRPHTRQQYLLVNGRHIKDRSLSFALKDAYRGLIMPRDQPVAFVFLTVDPKDVDVNVHPTKTEVRFRERDRVFGFVRNRIRTRILEESPDRPLELSARQGATTAPAPSREDLLDRLEHELFPAPSEGEASSAPESAEPLRWDSLPRTGLGDAVAESSPNVPSRSMGSKRCRGAQAELSAGAERRFLQLHASYIVVETDQGLRIIDQHALHERKIYEELKARVEKADVEVQHLLIPAVLELSSTDQECLLGFAADLARLGLEIEPFGGNAVCVRTVPSLLRRASPEDLVHELLDTLVTATRDWNREELLFESLAHLACRAAVKFNDPLPEEEIRALLAWYERNPQARNCPHGRPISVALTLRELEDQFLRKR